MKRLYITVIIFISIQILSAQINAYKQPYRPLQEYKKDTARYLKENFVDNKGQFIGKPLSYLANKLECKIVNVVPLGAWSTIYTEGVYFYFFPYNTYSSKDKSKILPLLIIKLKGRLSSVDSAYGFAKKNGAKWTKDEIDYYGHQIVGDISIPGLKNEDEPPYSDTEGMRILYNRLHLSKHLLGQ